MHNDCRLTWIKITFQDNVHCVNCEQQRHHRFGNTTRALFKSQ